MAPRTEHLEHLRYGQLDPEYVADQMRGDEGCGRLAGDDVQATTVTVDALLNALP